MSAKVLFGALGCAMLVMPAFAQTTAPSTIQPSATAGTPSAVTGQWRASKLIGLNVYNEQNEKLGEINEVLLDKSGKATGVVIGVGGFLGMGEHDVMIGFDKLKWVNEPVRTTTAPPATTTGTANPAARPARSASEMWYPDHAVLTATKDQLKAMQQFKYN